MFFVDTDTAMIKKNSVDLSDALKEHIHIVSRSYEMALDLIKEQNIVFFDPPWELKESYRQVFDMWLTSKQSQILIFEHSKAQALDFSSDVFQKTYSYGLTQLTVFRK